MSVTTVSNKYVSPGRDFSTTKAVLKTSSLALAKETLIQRTDNVLKSDAVFEETIKNDPTLIEDLTSMLKINSEFGDEIFNSPEFTHNVRKVKLLDLVSEELAKNLAIEEMIRAKESHFDAQQMASSNDMFKKACDMQDEALKNFNKEHQQRMELVYYQNQLQLGKENSTSSDHDHTGNILNSLPSTVKTTSLDLPAPPSSLKEPHPPVAPHFIPSLSSSTVHDHNTRSVVLPDKEIPQTTTPTVQTLNLTECKKYGNTKTETEKAKEQYLSGIRGSAMLGYHECIILSNFFERPIVAVKNNVVDSVYGEKFFDTGVNPIFVVNYNNFHFEGWAPNKIKAHYKSGDSCFGRKVAGNRAYSYGSNDCLIGAIRADELANQVLSQRFTENKSIRHYLADKHDQFFSSPAVYISDHSQYWFEQTFSVHAIDCNPADVDNYVGINLKVIPAGKNIEDCDDSEIQTLSGDIVDGVRDGIWYETDGTGRYEQLYNRGEKGERIQTHQRVGEDGLLFEV